jgi:hypothetical protein
MSSVRTIAHGLIALLVLSLLALGAPAAHAANPAQSATTRTVTVTEQEINSRYWVTNPRNRAVAQRSVDLQPGQVVITDLIERPRREPVTVVATLVPALADGRVTWSLSSATVNGQPASRELVEQINARISSSWVRYAKKRLGDGRVTAVSITEDTISYTIETAP